MISSFRETAPPRLRALLLASLFLPFPTVFASSNAFAQATGAPQITPVPNGRDIVDDGMRAVLSRYGSFLTHPKYGEVWVPTVAPRDWHPYLACRWVNSRKYGWYYDDKTPWGAIVHHYGRWAHDARMGWIWTAGSEFSPGWVAWRASPDYVGWAPLPPNDDIVSNGADAFNTGGSWTFMETERFDKGCGGGGVAPVEQAPVLLQQTQAITDITYVDGIAIAVLPTYVLGPLVDIDVVFKPWSSAFFTTILFKWNVIWNVWDVKTTVNYVDCTKKPPVAGHPPAPPPKPLVPVPPPSGPPPKPPKKDSSHPPLKTCLDGMVRPLDVPCGAPDPGVPPVIEVAPNPVIIPLPVPLPSTGIQKCVGVAGAEFRRCLTSGGNGTSQGGGPKQGPCEGLVGVSYRRCVDKRPNPPETHPPRPFRPVVDEPIKHEPIVHPKRPTFEKRPVFHGRPIFRPTTVFNPRPVTHARPVYHPRPVFHPRPTVSRPVFRRSVPAFHPATTGGGGARRRR